MLLHKMIYITEGSKRSGCMEGTTFSVTKKESGLHKGVLGIPMAQQMGLCGRNMKGEEAQGNKVSQVAGSQNRDT